MNPRLSFPAGLSVMLLLLQPLPVRADVVLVKGTGISQESPLGGSINAVGRGFDLEIRGFHASDPATYGQHRVLNRRSYRSITYAFNNQTDLGPSFVNYGTPYDYGYGVDFTDPEDHALWLSKTGTPPGFSEQATDLFVISHPALGTIFALHSSSLDVSTPPSRDLERVAEVAPPNTHFFRAELTGGLLEYSDLSAFLGSLDTVVNNMMASDGVYGTTASGLSSTATPEEIAAYVDANYITDMDRVVALDSVQGSPGEHQFRVTFTFWHSAAASSRVAQDLNEFMNNLIVYQMGLGFYSEFTDRAYTTIQRAVTPYEVWASFAPFDLDANGDGLANGLAFMLGADGPDDGALGLVPTGTKGAGTYTCSVKARNSASRGAESMSLQFATDFTVPDPWTSYPVPETSQTTGPVAFVVAPDPVNPELNEVTATITVAPETDTGSLFVRFMAYPD